MKKDGLTLTMVFLAESANYGEGVGKYNNFEKNDKGRLSTVLIYIKAGYKV